MKSIVNLVTVAALLLHFTLGCCAHHAHADEVSEFSGPETVVGQDHNCHCHGTSCHSSESCDESACVSDSHCPAQGCPDCPGTHCNDGQCVFMGAGKTLAGKNVPLVSIPLFVVTPIAIKSVSSEIATAIDSQGRVLLPVRPHLFNQVLLI